MYVYILRSIPNPKKHYVGLTSNLKNRLSQHNAGECQYTGKFRPWRLLAALWFSEKNKAALFERYLKTQSGRAFSAKHF